MILELSLAFATAVSLSLFLTPHVMRVATVLGAIDKPEARKVHATPIPRFGGVGVYLSFLISILLLLLLDTDSLRGSWIMSVKGLGFIASLLLIHATGILDDIRGLSAFQKFLVQFAVANIVYATGTHVSVITHPFENQPFSIGWLEYPITVLWVVGVTNAFNLVDGLDGLASGIAVIAFTSIFPIALFNGDMASAVVALVLAGSLIGFLKYNFNPARVFLGDSGSLMLGFTLAFVSIQSSTKGTAAFAFLAPVLSLGLPIMDTLLSMTRRFIKSFLPDAVPVGSFRSRLKAMFKPDRGHIHHRLIANGLTHRRAVLLMYGVSLLLGIGAFGVTVANNLTAALILVVIGAASIIGVRQLRYREMSVMQNGILLPLYQSPVMNRDSFQGYLDIAFMLVAHLVARTLTDQAELNAALSNAALTSTILVIAVQFVIFAATGMYRGTSQLLGVNDVLRAVRSSVFAVFVSSVMLTGIAQAFTTSMLVGFMLNFFFLTSMVLMFRSSKGVLRYLFHQAGKESDRRILIYGADSKGLLVLDKIVQLEYASMVPVGFLDDDPDREGRVMNGFPVFGGHYRLAQLHQKMRIDEIVIASETILPEVLRRVKRFAEQNRIKLTRLRFDFDDMIHEPLKIASPKIDVPVFRLDRPAVFQSKEAN